MSFTYPFTTGDTRRSRRGGGGEEWLALRPRRATAGDALLRRAAGERLLRTATGLRLMLKIQQDEDRRQGPIRGQCVE